MRKKIKIKIEFLIFFIQIISIIEYWAECFTNERNCGECELLLRTGMSTFRKDLSFIVLSHYSRLK